MKKSLVITTIATVLVIVVALTTATFAWFSASNETTATGIFTAQSTNAEFMFYPYLSNNNGYDYTNGQTLLDFSTATVPAQDSDRLFGVFTLDNMRPYVPNAVINNSLTPVTISSADSNTWAGLPGATFYTGTINTAGDKLSKAYNSATKFSEYATAGAPNIARFELYNPTTGDGASAKQLNVTFSIQGQGNAADIGVGNAIRFVMIGMPSSAGQISGANSAGKAFIIGTEYNYGGATVSSAASEVDYDGDAATLVQTDDYNVFTGGDTPNGNYVNLAAVETMGTNASGLIEYTFEDTAMQISPGASYEVYLYIWMDGTLVTDGSRGGVVQITIDFSVPSSD